MHDLLAREEASAADGGRATRLGGDALRAVEMRDFAAARRKMRVSVAKSSASRDAMKAWHEKFGVGSPRSGGEGIGFYWISGGRARPVGRRGSVCRACAPYGLQKCIRGVGIRTHG